MIRESSHTACHFPDFSKDSGTLSDGVFLAEPGAQAWHSRQGMRQGEPVVWLSSWKGKHQAADIRAPNKQRQGSI